MRIQRVDPHHVRRSGRELLHDADAVDHHVRLGEIKRPLHRLGRLRTHPEHRLLGILDREGKLGRGLGTNRRVGIGPTRALRPDLVAEHACAAEDEDA